jgi:hypothetical protein
MLTSARPSLVQEMTEASADHPSSVRCRLCNGTADFQFSKKLMEKYQVGFFRCQGCESLQSEQPYWLEEAYGDLSLAIDPGAAQRVLDCFAVTHAIMALLGFRRSLDYGGGAGLLCRLLRDSGHDSYWYDSYASPAYANGFAGSPADHFDLVTAIEVVEHFSEPRTDWDALFRGSPSALLIMTYLYRGETQTWWYIAPEEGQHVFFYSPKAIELIARRYGYAVFLFGVFILFSRNALTGWQRKALQFLIKPRILLAARALLIARGTEAPLRDSALLEERIRKRPESQQITGPISQTT